MNKLGTTLSAFALAAGGVAVAVPPADAAAGPVKHGSTCESLGYTKLVHAISLRKDGFGNKIGELRTLRKTGSSQSKWCTYLKKTGKTVGNKNQVRLKVTVLVRSGSGFTKKSASLTETVKYYSSSYTYTSLRGAKGTKGKTILNATTGIKSASSSTWYSTGDTIVG